MDWTTYCSGFWWIFPAVGLLFMAVMLLACHGMRARCGHGCTKPDVRQDGAATPTT